MSRDPNNVYAPPDDPGTRRPSGTETVVILDRELQQKFERKALRNVRNLVDKLKKEHENQDHLERNAVRALITLGTVAILLVLGFLMLPAPSGRVDLQEPQSSSEPAVR